MIQVQEQECGRNGLMEKCLNQKKDYSFIDEYIEHSVEGWVQIAPLPK